MHPDMWYRLAGMAPEMPGDDALLAIAKTRLPDILKDARHRSSIARIASPRDACDAFTKEEKRQLCNLHLKRLYSWTDATPRNATGSIQKSKAAVSAFLARERDVLAGQHRVTIWTTDYVSIADERRPFGARDYRKIDREWHALWPGRGFGGDELRYQVELLQSLVRDVGQAQGLSGGHGDQAEQRHACDIEPETPPEGGGSGQ